MCDKPIVWLFFFCFRFFFLFFIFTLTGHVFEMIYSKTKSLESFKSLHTKQLELLEIV